MLLRSILSDEDFELFQRCYPPLRCVEEVMMKNSLQLAIQLDVDLNIIHTLKRKIYASILKGILFFNGHFYLLYFNSLDTVGNNPSERQMYTLSMLPSAIPTLNITNDHFRRHRTTGFSQLDSMFFGGLPKASYVQLLGGLSSGKTQIALYITIHNTINEIITSKTTNSNKDIDIDIDMPDQHQMPKKVVFIDTCNHVNGYKIISMLEQYFYTRVDLSLQDKQDLSNRFFQIFRLYHRFDIFSVMDLLTVLQESVLHREQRKHNEIGPNITERLFDDIDSIAMIVLDSLHPLLTPYLIPGQLSGRKLKRSNTSFSARHTEHKESAQSSISRQSSSLGVNRATSASIAPIVSSCLALLKGFSRLCDATVFVTNVLEREETGQTYTQVTRASSVSSHQNVLAQHVQSHAKLRSGTGGQALTMSDICDISLLVEASPKNTNEHQTAFRIGERIQGHSHTFY
jgi:RecA/RadA recombinase